VALSLAAELLVARVSLSVAAAALILVPVRPAARQKVTILRPDLRHPTR